MGEHSKITPSGELIVPRQVLASKGWVAGTEVELEETAEGLLIRAARAKAPTERIDYEEFRRRVPKYEGPPRTLEDMQCAIDEAMAERWARKEANSR